MKPLSERYDAITGQHIINGEIVRKNVTFEVAQLEAENGILWDVLRLNNLDDIATMRMSAKATTPKDTPVSDVPASP